MKFIKILNKNIIISFLSVIGTLASLLFNIYIIDYFDNDVSSDYFVKFSFSAIFFIPTATLLKNYLLSYKFFFSKQIILILLVFLSFGLFLFFDIFVLGLLFFTTDLYSWYLIRMNMQKQNIIILKLCPYLTLFLGFFLGGDSSAFLIIFFIVVFFILIFIIFVFERKLLEENKIMPREVFFKNFARQALISYSTQAIFWIPLQILNFYKFKDTVIMYRMILQLRTLMMFYFNSVKSIVIFDISKHLETMNNIYIKNVRTNSYLSLISILLIYFVFIVISFFDLSFLESNTLNILEKNRFIIHFAFLIAFGDGLFGYTGTYLSMTMNNDLYFKKIIAVSLSCCLLLSVFLIINTIFFKLSYIIFLIFLTRVCINFILRKYLLEKMKIKLIL
jgi:hypothetical protein